MTTKGSIVAAQDGVVAEVFVPPSREMVAIARLLGGLIVPRDGRPSLPARLFGNAIVAPFTQLTFVNFELQAFLFRVFHRHLGARLGHGLFMPAVVFFSMAFLAQFRTTLGGVTVSGAHAYAIVLALWYLVLAVRERFYLWWFAAVGMTAALAAGADAYHRAFALHDVPRAWWSSTPLVYEPLMWMGVSAVAIMLSHAFEADLPPRIWDRWEWRSVHELLFGTVERRNGFREFAGPMSKIVLQSFFGTINEWWASPRLMPYTLLYLMFAAGYRPERYRELEEQASRAIASGNPALDYIGIGGGTYLSRDYVDAA